MTATQFAVLIVGCVGPSLIVSWAATHFVRRRAQRWGLLDKPGPRKVHTPRLRSEAGWRSGSGSSRRLPSGSLLFGFGTSAHPKAPTCSPAYPFADFIRPHLPGLWAQSPDLWLLLGLATLLMLLGLADDRRGVDWRLRLAVQIGVAAAVVFGRGWKLNIAGGWPWLAGGLSLVWIVGLVNSFNMLDNMDGLSAGVGTIAAAMLAAVMLMAPDPQTHQPHLFVAGFLLVLVGALLGFLWHNRPPARIFMGDAGSYFLGFSLATIATVTTYVGGDLPGHADPRADLRAGRAALRSGHCRLDSAATRAQPVRGR